MNPNEQQSTNVMLLCSHEETGYRTKHDSLKRPLIALQCLHCGKKITDFVSVKFFSTEEIAAMPLWDMDLELSWKAKVKMKSGERHLEHKEQRALQKELQREQYIKQQSARQAAYARYTKSPQWQELRRKVIERAKGVCEGCGNQRATDVHHLTYQRFGKEMLFDLVAICKECHRAIHTQSKAATDANYEIGLALMAQEMEDKDET